MSAITLDIFEHGILTHRSLILSITAAMCALFLGVVFLQSGYDKVRNFQGNLAYFKSQFANSPLRNATNILLIIVTILELLSGVVSIAGIAMLACLKGSHWLGAGCALSAITLICLLTGQRIAKDYAGAASLTGYFIIAVLGMFAYAFSSGW